MLQTSSEQGNISAKHLPDDQPTASAANLSTSHEANQAGKEEIEAAPLSLDFCQEELANSWQISALPAASATVTGSYTALGLKAPAQVDCGDAATGPQILLAA